MADFSRGHGRGEVMVAKTRRLLKRRMLSWKSFNVECRFFSPAAPVAVGSHGTAAQDAQHQLTIAVEHPAGIFRRSQIETSVQAAWPRSFLAAVFGASGCWSNPLGLGLDGFRGG
jgi:hypothetical protein